MQKIRPRRDRGKGIVQIKDRDIIRNKCRQRETFRVYETAPTVLYDFGTKLIYYDIVPGLSYDTGLVYLKLSMLLVGCRPSLTFGGRRDISIFCFQSLKKRSSIKKRPRFNGQ